MLPECKSDLILALLDIPSMEPSHIPPFALKKPAVFLSQSAFSSGGRSVDFELRDFGLPLAGRQNTPTIGGPQTDRYKWDELTLINGRK